VIISKAFFSKNWPQDELAGLATRESDGKKIILPIWHQISAAEVREKSPILADKIALHWTNTPHTMIKALVRAMDLPFRATDFFGGSTLSGFWLGVTGRLRLLYDGDDYTPYQFYDGDYDWNGREWSGHVRGAFSRNDRTFLFRWFWDHGAERGIGFFDFNEQEEALRGGWKTSSKHIAFGLRDCQTVRGTSFAKFLQRIYLRKFNNLSLVAHCNLTGSR
jgi:hypothetical protein